MRREKEIRKMLGRNYHLNVESCFGICPDKWRLFKKYDNGDPIYWSEDNKAIMTSDTHTEDELYKFAKQHQRVDAEKIGRNVRFVMLMVLVILSTLNAIFWHDTGVSTMILTGDVIIVIWACIDFYCANQNFKINMLEITENHERFKMKLKEAKEDETKRIYNMLKEFHYEKNGVEETINFLTYVIEELKKKLKIEGETKNVKKRGRKKKEETKKDA